MGRCILTRYELSSVAWFEAGKDWALVMCAVNTGLNTLLQHRRSSARAKVIWQWLDTACIQMGTHFPVLIQIHTYWDTQIIAGKMLAKILSDKDWNIYLGKDLRHFIVPVGACRAALGMVALSSGTELVSGSGVLLLGEVGIGLGPNLGFLCIKIIMVCINNGTL